MTWTSEKLHKVSERNVIWETVVQTLTCCFRVFCFVSFFYYWGSAGEEKRCIKHSLHSSTRYSYDLEMWAGHQTTDTWEWVCGHTSWRSAPRTATQTLLLLLLLFQWIESFAPRCSTSFWTEIYILWFNHSKTQSLYKINLLFVSWATVQSFV